MTATYTTIRLERVTDKIGSGKTPEGGADAYVPDGVMFIRSQNVHFEGLRLDDVVFIDDDTDGAMASTRVRPGDVLLNITGASLGRVTIAPANIGRANVNQHVCIVRPSGKVVPRFVMWCLQSQVIQERIIELQVGGNRDGLTFEQVGDFEIPHPSLANQRAIADFLDPEMDRIDALVAKKRRLIELLDEQKAGIASEALLSGPPKTGAGPGACQGTFPRHWQLIPFRWLFREVDERSETGAEELLSVSQTRGVIPQSELGDRHQYADSYIGYKLCRAGDLIVNRMWVYYGALGVAPVDGMVSPDYAVYRATSPTPGAQFVAEVLRTPAFVGEMTRRVRGIGVAFQGTVRKPRLHSRDLGQINIPVPPRSEVRSILETLAESRSRSNELIVAEERMIDLLDERRQALITAAVTGQLDISEAAA